MVNEGLIEINNLRAYKKKYPYYCEVIITPNGKIYKANPSHQVALMIIAANNRQMGYKEFIEWSAQNYSRSDLILWLDTLLKETGCIAVWYNFFEGNPNNNQLKALDKLKKLEVCNINIYQRK